MQELVVSYNLIFNSYTGLMNRHRLGTISIPPHTVVERHEKITADFLAKKGYDLTFITPSRQPGIKSADIRMLQNDWEIKSPVGKSVRTIENIIRVALRQSAYVVLDLRRMDTRIPTHRHVTEIRKRFKDAKVIKRILIITREGKLIDFSRTY